jgi:hypothetical protein
MATTLIQYASVAPLLGALPSWIGNDADAQRYAAYQVYENMYWNVPDTFKLVQRGSDSKPVYIPSPRIIVEATNRFLAKDWDFLVDPKIGTPADQELIGRLLRKTFKRELMWSKFPTQRRYGLIRGDTCWHITANDLKAEGTRVSIHELDPSSYFPILDPDNMDKILGCHIVDQITFGEDIVVRRQTYRKTPNNTVTSELSLFELGAWDDRDPAAEVKQVAVVTPLFELNPLITSLPVYHIKNNRTPGDEFGSSELRGFEMLAASVNQTMSDQELSLALDGIGLYATTSGPPTDEDGNETNWILGPGRVAEIEEGTTFERVSGVTNLPGLDHVRFIMGTMQQAAAVPDIAAGNVDVSIAESGIALYLQLSPILSKNAEKEAEMLGVYDHMLYDLTQQWFPAYEAIPSQLDVEVASIVGDPMPVNREARIQELINLVTAQMISVAYAQQELAKYGYDVPTEMVGDIVAEQAALGKAANPDPFASRVASELEDRE